MEKALACCKAITPEFIATGKIPKKNSGKQFEFFHKHAIHNVIYIHNNVSHPINFSYNMRPNILIAISWPQCIYVLV
jgi:hypothetical protein